MINESVEQPIEFIRLPEVERITGFKTTTIYKMANDGTFPRQVKLGARAVAWVKSEVLAWNREQVIRSRAHVAAYAADDQQPMNNQS